MPRRRFNLVDANFPIHISARVHNRDRFPLPLEEVWRVFCVNLNKAHIEQGLLIHSFVLMPNHFHLLATAPEMNISECMHQIMRASSLHISQRAMLINQLYGNRHYKTAINDERYWRTVYKYIYRNPVEGCLSSKVEGYQFSTLRQRIRGFGELSLEVDHLYSSNPVGVLEWLNTAPQPENKESVRRALRKGEFKLAKRRGCENSHPLEKVDY